MSKNVRRKLHPSPPRPTVSQSHSPRAEMTAAELRHMIGEEIDKRIHVAPIEIDRAKSLGEPGEATPRVEDSPEFARMHECLEKLQSAPPMTDEQMDKVLAANGLPPAPAAADSPSPSPASGPPDVHAKPETGWTDRLIAV